MPTLNVQELKKALVKAGFDVYRTRGDEVHLAERPRENLIMEAGIVVAAGDPPGVRVVVRAQKSDFPGDSDDKLLDRARALASTALARGYAEQGTGARTLHDPGDATKVLDTWYEVSFVKPVASVDEVLEEVAFVSKLEKAATP
jgi:hypothetical protein